MPPKKNKAGPRNAFYHFMLDFKGTQGRHFNNLRDVSEAASPHWNRMNKEQRRPYEEKAMMERNSMRPGKYTSEGLDVQVLENQDKAEQQKIEDMKNEINQELKIASSSGQIQDKMFLIIDINIFCYSNSENRYYPAEISIAPFNLENGVSENVFHAMIKPGVLPLGYASTATLHSKETHQISAPLGDDVENNIEDIFIALKKFLQNILVGSKRTPIFYCDEKDINKVKQILDTWCMDYEDDTVFKVYNLQYMFRILRNCAAQKSVWLSDTFSCREIEKDVYAYGNGIACEFHSLTDVPNYCSRSKVIRYAFTICDNCCEDLNIHLVPGCHVPSNAYTELSRPGSVASSISRSSRKVQSTVREDDSESVISYSSKSEWDNQSVTSSSSSMMNDEDDFPSLGRTKRNEIKSPGPWNYFTPNDASSLFSQSTTRSYAGATGTSGLSRRPAEMPSYVSGMEKLSLNSSMQSSETYRQEGHFRNEMKDFPSLGRGRPATASKGRGVRRPNNDS